jgi:hypothetical protein
MTKFDVTVCLPARGRSRRDDAARAVLKQYDHNLDPDGKYNPDGEWEWWYINGDLLVRPEFR